MGATTMCVRAQTPAQGVIFLPVINADYVLKFCGVRVAVLSCLPCGPKTRAIITKGSCCTAWSEWSEWSDTGPLHPPILLHHT
jgi:hypothetical protein